MSGSITFPPNPTTGQIFTDPNGVTWKWNGTAWVNANQAGNFATVAQATTIATNISSANVGRNLLHNGLMNIWQRGVGPFTTAGYTADRWSLGIAGDTASVTRQTLTDANRAAIGDEAAEFCIYNAFTGTAAATAYTLLAHRIEDVRRLSGKTVIVSFWATAGTSGLKLGASIDQNMGTGGTPSANVNGAGQAFTLTASPARYFGVFTVPSLSGMTLGTNGDHSMQLNLWQSSGTNNATRAGSIGVQSGNIWLWGVQLEIAQAGQTQPTPLEKLDPQMDLANCQRFFRSVAALNIAYYADIAGRGGNLNVVLQPPMRVTPTVVATQTSGVNFSGGSVYTVSPTTIGIQMLSAAAGWSGCTNTFTASADL